jgi:hypothetical protein
VAVQKVAHEVVLAHLAKTYLLTLGYFRDDRWYEATIGVEGLYNTQSDFRGFAVPKGERYVDIWPVYLSPLVTSGALRFMPDGCLKPSHICCYAHEGRMYVIDGALRVFNAVQFGVARLPAYIWRQGETESEGGDGQTD